MIVCEPQAVITEWLCSKLGLIPTPNVKCIGILDVNQRLKGVVGYDRYNGCSVEMSVYGEGNWLTSNMLWAIFDYPFNVLNANVAIILVSSANVASLKFVTHLGFTLQTILKGAHPDGDMLILSMSRRECRHLERKIRGQKAENT